MEQGAPEGSPKEATVPKRYVVDKWLKDGYPGRGDGMCKGPGAGRRMLATFGGLKKS
jgi:hypothetical protein